MFLRNDKEINARFLAELQCLSVEFISAQNIRLVLRQICCKNVNRIAELTDRLIAVNAENVRISH